MLSFGQCFLSHGSVLKTAVALLLLAYSTLLAVTSQPSTWQVDEIAKRAFCNNDGCNDKRSAENVDIPFEVISYNLLARGRNRQRDNDVVGKRVFCNVDGCRNKRIAVGEKDRLAMNLVLHKLLTSASKNTETSYGEGQRRVDSDNINYIY